VKLKTKTVLIHKFNRC